MPVDVAGHADFASPLLAGIAPAGGPAERREGGPSRRRSGAWKAVTLLNILDAPTLEKLLQHFDREDLARIQALDMELEPVPADELARIVEEFAQRFARRLSMVGDRRRPVSLLEEVLGAEEVARIMGDGGAVWEDERFASPEVLEPIVRHEHPQLAAFILSRVDSELTATLCAMLDDERRNDILLRMLHMRAVDPGVVMCVEGHIRVTFIEGGAAELAAEARSRLASIVNRMDKKLVERFLELLKERDPKEAAELKKMLFAFEDVARLDKKDRLVLFDQVPAEVTIKALHGAAPELREVVLEALGGRMRKMVEAELSGGAAPPEDEIQAAQQEIAATALELARNGEISLPADE